MADNKKYYYIRLKENFFDSDEIKLLESIPNDGYKFSNILLKMYLKSLKYDGRLMFNERIPFNAEMLATVTGHSLGDVTRAIDMFKKFGLIEVLETGEIYMLDIQSFIGKTSTEADRKRRYRSEIDEKKSIGTNVRQNSDKSTPEIELEIEKEIDIETDINKEPTAYQKIVAVYEKNGFGLVSPIVSEKINDELKDFASESNEDEAVSIITKAMEIAALNSANNFNYVLAITKKWYNKKLFTLKAVEADELKSKSQKASRYGGRRNIIEPRLASVSEPVDEPERELPEWLTDAAKDL
ncbi:phage replisome organizer N-terminal domain-containing protein [Leuconostoc sp. UCMA20149]|uniref:phage replisome organizer N-terminal domain-containing protein n=1 Tax=Leuconostoc sp. UCMA20149 TaxID=2583528 RepID=UPI0025B1B015|nr:phage replisome organizer N-terminal domain-containing protein [Leuconostoc sp. UCMA20149]MDN2450062.1 DnaD domain protein [Leuconostoc sp. UCMA20149]